MKISVITAVYNNLSMIKSALESVKSQSYTDIEYIVIDGSSTDGTKEFLDQNIQHITTFISEPDNGIYDALNKGIKLATGDIICFLHADDVYSDNDVLKEVANHFKNNKVDSVYGNLVYVSKDDINNVVRYWKSGEFSRSKLNFGWMPPHPAFFVKKEIYEKYGFFDTTYTIAADYDFILRILGTKNLSTSYIDRTLYKMRLGGVSNRNIKSIIMKSREDYKALKKNNVGSVFTLIFKNISKIPQFIISNFEFLT